ncbi:MAG TPA: 50S ribosomal protein L25/general stress protein Ctc [Bacteroidales bacterium]|nr:50S ribosomal protein L25/general stress protein Ctc [Bacteroidales bacterium]
MKSVSMSGSLRENVGKKDAKAQRSQGLVPCVMYGGTEQFTFVVDEKQFKDIIFTPEVKYAELEIEGKKYTTIIQDTQWHPITDALLHVDFLEIVPGKNIVIGIPITIVGTSPGVLRGGKLIKKVRKLKVKGLLQDIPEKIEVDITPLDINDVIKVGDIKLNNLTVMDNKSQIVVMVASTRNVTDTPEK